MPVLVTSNFDDDSIKNERASMKTPFSHYEFIVNCPVWPKCDIVRDFMHVLITCKYKKGSDQKQPRKGGDNIFRMISQWGLSVAMDTRVLIQSTSKHYAAFPHPE